MPQQCYINEEKNSLTALVVSSLVKMRQKCLDMSVLNAAV